MSQDLKKEMKNYWPLISGVLFILLGLYVLFNPAATLIALSLYIGIIFIVVGSSYMMAFLSWNHFGHLALGLLDIFIGIILISNLGLTTASLPIIFALWTIFIGIIQIVEAMSLKNMMFPWKITMTSGIVAIIFGFFLAAFPTAGAITITILLGSYIILYGAMGIVEYHLLKTKH